MHLEYFLKICRRPSWVEQGNEAVFLLQPTWLVSETKKYPTNVSLPKQPPLQVTSEPQHCLDYTCHCLAKVVWGKQGKEAVFYWTFGGGKWTRFQVQSPFIESDGKQRIPVVWLEDDFMLSSMKAALRGQKTMKISMNFLKEGLAKVIKLWKAF